MQQRFTGLRALVAVAAMALAFSASAQRPAELAALPPPSDTEQRLEFAALDRTKLASEDAAARRAGLPYRYGIAHALKRSTASDGRWETLADGRVAWRLSIRADQASSIDIGFSQWRLPHGAELWFSDAAGSVVHGPYTDAHNPREGGLSLPLVPGSEALLEVVVPAHLLPYTKLELDRVSQGYRHYGEAGAEKSGTCNLDVACPQGNPWRDQIRSVARYTFSSGGGSFFCTGQLVNRVAGDRDPLFLTANHCVSAPATVSTMVLHWGYESGTCRAVNTAGNGTVVPIESATATQSGATLVATSSPSDLTLVRLNQAPPAAANAYWSGWDRRNVLPANAVAIHHPQGHEKRISFDNDPLALSDYEPSPRGNNTTHLKVFDWEVGTTEGGSSGSAIWNADKRIVGTLHGGFAACGNNEADYYGRFAVSWTGGGTAATRLLDHLGPAAGTAPEVLDGTGTCEAPTVTLAVSANPVAAGSDLTLTAQASGGAGNYTYSWDVDGDGQIDRTGPATSVIARYDRAQSINVSVRVRDGGGCEATVQRAVDVVAANIRLAGAIGAPVQVCGNGDGVIDPGERWRIDANLVNNGTRPSGENTLGLFAESVSDALATTPRDSFGYTVIDSSNPDMCGYQFVDISSQVQPLPLTAAGTVSAADDGRTGVLDLGGANAFNFYGQTVTQAVLSTNGYIGISSATTGGDFNNLCGPIPDRDNNGPRMQVFHDDLVAGSLRAAAFAECPRPSRVGPNPSRCLVFQWNNMGLYSGAGVTPTGDFDFQAIIYPSTWEIAYQYRNASPNAGAGATVAILDPDVSGRQLLSSCNQAVVTPQRAVCYFHPQKLPAGGSDLSKLRIESPVVPIGALDAGATRTVSTVFAVDPSTECGSRYRIGFAGATDDLQGTSINQPLQFEIGNGGSCNAVNNCANSLAPGVTLRPGAFFNPRRDGNGMISHVVPVAGQLPTFFGAWYTGDSVRLPTWYIIQGSVQDNQVVAPILRFTRDLAAPSFAVRSQPVGVARVQLLESERLLLNYSFDAGLSGSEFLQHGFQGLANANPNYTGVWFNAQEDGWGQTYDSYIGGGGVARDFITTYLYDNAGQPRWLIADAPATDVGDLPSLSFRIHCPGCAWVEFQDTATAAGTMRRSFGSPTGGSLSTGFTLPAPLQGNWNRNAIPITILTPPQAP